MTMDIKVKNKDPQYIRATDLKRSEVCILTKYKLLASLSEHNKTLLAKISNPGYPLQICISGPHLVAVSLQTAELIPMSLFYDVSAEFKLCNAKLDVTIL